MPNSQLLQFMGLPRDEEDISYDICLDLSNASWDEVSSRITTHPSEVSEEDCLHGNSPLEILVKSKSKEEIPLDVYYKLLKEESPGNINEGIFIKIVRKQYSDEYMESLMNLFLDFTHVVDGRRLMDMSIWYGNVAAVKVIIERFPDALKRKDAVKGQLPLHVACEEDNSNVRQWEIIELLLEAGVQYNVCGETGAGGLFEKDNKGRSPLMQIIRTMNNPFMWDAVHFENCVRIAYKSSRSAISFSIPKMVTFQARPDEDVSYVPEYDEIYDHDGRFHFPILHEAMLISSPEAFYRIVEIVRKYDRDLAGKDRRGRTALIKAIYLDHEESERKSRYNRKTSTSEVIKMIFSAVTSDCAKIRDGAGRLPIHIATEMGLRWNEGVGLIVFAHDKGLEEKHCVTGLYPFMMAAAGRSNDLNTIFMILRARPGVLTDAAHWASLQVADDDDDDPRLKPSPLRKVPVHLPLVPSWEHSPSSQTAETISSVNSSLL